MDNMLSKKQKFGFSLIEALVAVSIFLLVIPAFFSSVLLFVNATTSAKDEVTALYLAQDAVEYIRAKISDNGLSGVTLLDGSKFDDGFGSCIPSPQKTCIIDSRNDDDVTSGSNRFVQNASWDLSPCSPNCPVLRYNQSTGEYGYSNAAGWQDSRYTRWVDFEGLDSKRELRVTVFVSWPSVFGTKEVVLQTLLFRP